MVTLEPNGSSPPKTGAKMSKVGALAKPLALSQARGARPLVMAAWLPR